MPNLPTHIYMTQKAASLLNNPIINDHMGSFVLGCTSPDIRIITKREREQTHFAPLTIKEIGAGMESMFFKYPALAETSTTNDPTKAFLCGYICHLVADEAWILEIYHPHLATSQDPPNHILANIWDRALQLEMDCAAHAELGQMGQIRTWLDQADSHIDVGFLDTNTLNEWRTWVSEFTTWEFTWERLKILTRRMYKDDPQAGTMVNHFLSRMPDSLEDIHDKISRNTIKNYQSTAIHESVRFMEQYLNAR